MQWKSLDGTVTLELSEPQIQAIIGARTVPPEVYEEIKSQVRNIPIAKILDILRGWGDFVDLSIPTPRYGLRKVLIHGAAIRLAEALAHAPLRPTPEADLIEVVGVEAEPLPEGSFILADNLRGIWIPKFVIENYEISGLDDEDLAILSDPYHEEHQDRFESMLSNASITHEGKLYSLVYDGDMWAVPLGEGGE